MFPKWWEILFFSLAQIVFPILPHHQQNFWRVRWKMADGTFIQHQDVLSSSVKNYLFPYCLQSVSTARKEHTAMDAWDKLG